jgi:thiol-disulfide isomerase/thioredoxin
MPKAKKAKADASWFDRNFFLGLGAGALLALALGLPSAYFLAYKPFQDSMASLIESALGVPAFPAKLDLKAAAGADYAWKVQDLQGRDFDLASLKGKTVFLNFWATWCLPCVAEMGGIDRLYKGLQADPHYAFVCLTKESPDTVAAFIKKKGFSLPVYLYQGTAPAAYASKAIPVTFLLTPSGKIAFKGVGASKWDADACKAFLEKIAEEKKGGGR